MPKYYLLDENKNLVEGFDKEGFLALLEQAIEDGSLENIDENSAVASKLKSVLNGTTHNIEFVTQAQYNELEAQGQLVANTYYHITDDTTFEGLEAQLNSLLERVSAIENGDFIIPKATNSENAEKTSFTNSEWQSQVLDENSVTSVELEFDTLKNRTFEVIFKWDEEVKQTAGITAKISKYLNFGTITAFAPEITTNPVVISSHIIDTNPKWINDYFRSLRCTSKIKSFNEYTKQIIKFEVFKQTDSVQTTDYTIHVAGTLYYREIK